ncbi:putative reverse transcriptase domain-containing protein [Tanacetum coccineum]
MSEGDVSIGGRLLTRQKESTFPGKKAGPPKEHANHFKWALCDWILDGIVNTKFTDVAKVANAARNMKILYERPSQNNKRNRDGDCRVATVIKSHDITEVSSTTILLGLQARHVIGYWGCLTCGLTGHMARDCPKNGGNGGRRDENDNQPAAKGRVFSLTKDQAANSSGSCCHHQKLKPTQIEVIVFGDLLAFVSGNALGSCGRMMLPYDLMRLKLHSEYQTFCDMVTIDDLPLPQQLELVQWLARRDHLVCSFSVRHHFGFVSMYRRNVISIVEYLPSPSIFVDLSNQDA